MVEGIGPGSNKPSLNEFNNIKVEGLKKSLFDDNKDSVYDNDNVERIQDITLNTDIKEKASAIKDIRYLQDILANTELYDVDFETQRIYIQQKSETDSYPVVAHRINDGSENGEKQFYYEFNNGNIYHYGDFGFDNIDSMFKEICRKLEEAHIEE